MTGLISVVLNVVGAAVLGGSVLAAGSSYATPGRVLGFMGTFLATAFMAPVTLISGEQVHTLLWLPSAFLFTGSVCVLVGAVRNWLPLRILGHIVITTMFLIPALFFAANIGEFLD